MLFKFQIITILYYNYKLKKISEIHCKTILLIITESWKQYVKALTYYKTETQTILLLKIYYSLPQVSQYIKLTAATQSGVLAIIQAVSSDEFDGSSKSSTACFCKNGVG